MNVSTFVLCLTSLEVASLHALRRSLDEVRSWEFARERVKIVLNVSNAADSIGKKDVETMLDFPVFWQIPYDTNVAIASQLGKPVVQLRPKSRASQCISDLLMAISKPGQPVKTNQGLLGAVAQLARRGR